MTKKKSADRSGAGFDGIFKGLGDLVEKLSDLAEKGEQLSRTPEPRPKSGAGFKIKY
jgi:hypothetical protein